MHKYQSVSLKTQQTVAFLHTNEIIPALGHLGPASLQALLATSLPLSIRLTNLTGRRRCGESETQKQAAAGQDSTPPVLSSSVSDGLRATAAFSIKTQWEVE